MRITKKINSKNMLNESATKTVMLQKEYEYLTDNTLWFLPSHIHLPLYTEKQRKKQLIKLLANIFKKGGIKSNGK